MLAWICRYWHCTAINNSCFTCPSNYVICNCVRCLGCVRWTDLVEFWKLRLKGTSRTGLFRPFLWAPSVISPCLVILIFLFSDITLFSYITSVLMGSSKNGNYHKLSSSVLNLLFQNLTFHVLYAGPCREGTSCSTSTRYKANRVCIIIILSNCCLKSNALCRLLMSCKWSHCRSTKKSKKWNIDIE